MFTYEQETSGTLCSSYYAVHEYILYRSSELQIANHVGESIKPVCMWTLWKVGIHDVTELGGHFG